MSTRRNLLFVLAGVVVALGLISWGLTVSINRSQDSANSTERASAAKMTTWVKAEGPWISTLRMKADNLAAAARKRLVATAAANANGLLASVNIADAQPLVPDGQGNADWETALADYSSAAQSALAAADGPQAQDLSNADSLVSAGDAQLTMLNQRIQDVTG